MNVPPIAPACAPSMISALPMTPESGSPPAIDFATVTRSGSTPKCSIANIRAVRPKPVWTSSATRTMPCSSQIRRNPATNASRSRDEAALAELGLEHDRRHVVGGNLGRHCRERRLRVGPAVRVRVRRPVDLRRERAEPGLVRVLARGHRQRQQRPAVERALERDHAWAPRVEPGELDGVLDRLRARVEEGRPGLALDGDEPPETLRELDVQLVRDNCEIDVNQALSLLLDRLDDTRMPVADVRDPDATDEVDERVAVDVGDRRAARLGGDDRDVHDERPRDRSGLAFEDLARTRPGNLRPELDHASRRHPPQRTRAAVRRKPL